MAGKGAGEGGWRVLQGVGGSPGACDACIHSASGLATMSSDTQMTTGVRKSEKGVYLSCR